MPIEGFDYKAFAQSMTEQAKQLVPQELEDREKEYIVNTLGNFTMLSGEALYNDTQLNLNVDQAVLITQIIAEWSFHKSIDLIHSGILPQYWDSIMQKIAFTIFEVAKQAVIRNIPQDQMLQAIEHHVNKVYKESIQELQNKGIIDEEVSNNAQNQSNIDAMAKQVQEEQQKQVEEQQKQRQQNPETKPVETMSEADRKWEERKQKRKASKEAKNAIATISNGITHKQLKLMTLALVMKILPSDKASNLLNKFSAEDSTAISGYMNIVDLESHIDSDLLSGCINEIKASLPSKRILTKDNVLGDLLSIYKVHSREKIEKIIKNERPFVKRFIATSYEGEYFELPLKVAGVIAQYVEDSV